MSRISVTYENHIAHVLLTRSDKMNAVDQEMITAIIAAGDEIATSDAYLLQMAEDRELIEVRYKRKQRFAERIGVGAEAVIDRLALRVWKRVSDRQFL